MATEFHDPHNFIPQESIGYLLKVNHVLLQEQAATVLSEYELSFHQWIALLKLDEGSARTASEICRTMMHDNGALTRLIDNLEKRGFLRRERSQQDRRVVQLILTPQGTQAVREMTPKIVGHLNEAMDQGFSLDEFNTLIHLLGKLKLALQGANASESSPSK